VCFCTDSQSRLISGYTTVKVTFLPMRAGCRVRTVCAPELIELTQEFVTRTGFIGFGELEFVESSRGPLLLELNARPWAQVMMTEFIGQPILRQAVELMTGQDPTGQVAKQPLELEYLIWDRDLLVRRALRKRGEPRRSLPRVPRVHGISLWRDFWPAVHYSLRHSRLGPARFRKSA
jgi:predicted ATP-grasp superfamily ATP-dependent carboligase